MPVAAAPEARPPADVAALTAALEAAAQTVEVRLDTKGRVRALEVRQWERAAAFVNSYPEPYVRAFVKAHGDRFGYGPLGEASDDIALNDEELGGPASLLVPYPKAQGCPGLAVLFRYTYGHDVTGLVGTPLSWEVLCPTEPGALHRIQEAREQGRGDVAGSRAVTAALKDEPIVRWLVDHGFGRPTMVAREKDRIRVGLRYLGGPETRKPEALAREVAEGAAEVSGLPKLDKVTVRYREGSKSRPKRIAGVELAESRATGDYCVAPRVVVSLRENAHESQAPSVEEAVFAHTLFPLLAVLGLGQALPRGEDVLSGGMPSYGVYATRDGRYMAVSAMEPKFWQGLCEAIERPDLKPFVSAFGAEGQRIRRELELAFAERSFAEWTAVFERVDCCVTPVLRLEESIENAQLRARAMIVEVDGVKQFGPPFKISDLPFEARLPPPAAGEHSEDVLRAAGFSDQEIAGLRAQKVI